MSSSLPYDVQVALYHTVPGLENAVLMRPAYAIEYDCIDPQSIFRSTMTKSIPGLFTAGQINGTSGYEEAAGQGLLAGINASRYIDQEEPVTLQRTDAYIGVLLDDLVTKGTNEPYRMMTARAEHRLLLRQDNADVRLTELGRKIGLVDQKRYDQYMRTKASLGETDALLRKQSMDAAACNALFMEKGLEPPDRRFVYAELLRRPEFSYDDLALHSSTLAQIPEDIALRAETEIKYEGYIQKQHKQVEKALKLEKQKLPENILYANIKGLRLEARQKLDALKPETVGQAARISGVSPADISVLLVYLSSI